MSDIESKINSETDTEADAEVSADSVSGTVEDAETNADIAATEAGDTADAAESDSAETDADADADNDGRTEAANDAKADDGTAAGDAAASDREWFEAPAWDDGSTTASDDGAESAETGQEDGTADDGGSEVGDDDVFLAVFADEDADGSAGEDNLVAARDNADVDTDDRVDIDGDDAADAISDAAVETDTGDGDAHVDDTADDDTAFAGFGDDDVEAPAEEDTETPITDDGEAATPFGFDAAAEEAAGSDAQGGSETDDIRQADVDADAAMTPDGDGDDSMYFETAFDTTETAHDEADTTYIDDTDGEALAGDNAEAAADDDAESGPDDDDGFDLLEAIRAEMAAGAEAPTDGDGADETTAEDGDANADADGTDKFDLLTALTAEIKAAAETDAGSIENDSAFDMESDFALTDDHADEATGDTMFDLDLEAAIKAEIEAGARGLDSSADAAVQPVEAGGAEATLAAGIGVAAAAAAVAEEEDVGPVDRDLINAAYSRIRGKIRRTPVFHVQPGDLGLSTPSVLKLELQQYSGSFKTRGAFNNLLSREVPEAGIVAASGGNHGAAVAYAAERLGHHAKIFVPETASTAKINLIKRLGAEIHVEGDRYADAAAMCDAYQVATGAMQIHAYDSATTIAGQGTLGLEWEQQALGLDAIVVAVGGGGLIAGLSAWFEDRITIIGVEPEGARALHAARAAGTPVDVEIDSVAADSLGARRVGDRVFEITQRHVDDVVLVDDDQIRDAQARLWKDMRIAAEPGGATALAALINGAYEPKWNERVGILVCGGNVELTKLASLAV